MKLDQLLSMLFAEHKNVAETFFIDARHLHWRMAPNNDFAGHLHWLVTSTVPENVAAYWLPGPGLDNQEGVLVHHNFRAKDGIVLAIETEDEDDDGKTVPCKIYILAADKEVPV